MKSEESMERGKRYVRFMSFEELMKYMGGRLLVNHTDWRKAAQCTDSVGFCFFDDSIPPEKRIEYLTGVVTMDCVAIFERTTDKPMRKSQGRYRDPEKDQNIFNLLAPPPMMSVDEYSVESYSMKDMRLAMCGVVEDAFKRRIKWV